MRKSQEIAAGLERVSGAYRRIIDISPDAIVAIDLNGRVNLSNPAAESMFNYQRGEMIGMPATDLMPEEYRERHIRGLKRLLETGESVLIGKTIEIEGLKKDGSRFPIELSLSAENSEGNWVFIGIIRDITERKRLEKEVAERFTDVERLNTIIKKAEKEWEATFDAMKDLIFIHDNDFKIVRVNRAYQEAAGMSFKDIIGRPYYEIFPKIEGPFKMCQEVMKTGETTREEEIFIPCINKVFKVSLFPIHEMKGRSFLFAHVMEDITERNEVTERLREEAEINKSLLDLLEAISTTFDQNEMLKKVVETVPWVIDAERCSIFWWDKELRAFTPVVVGGMAQELMPGFLRIKFTPDLPLMENIMRKENVRIDDAMDHPLFPKEIAQAFSIRSLLYTPITGKDEVMGFIAGIRIGIPRPFGEREEIFLKGVSHQISIALDNARLYKEMMDKALDLSRRVETLRVMHEIDKNILSSLESQEVLEMVTVMVSGLVPADRVTVVMVDKERREFVYKAGFGAPVVQKGAPVSFKDTSAAEILRTKMACFNPDLAAERELLPLEKALLENGYLSHIRVPMVVKGDVTGLLCAGSKRTGVFTADHLNILERLAPQVAVAIENSRLVADLKELILGIVKSLSAAIDAKSRWTAGHSERVTRYALSVAREMGMDEKGLKDLELAGLLHDIGKIGTYDIILDKPGKLTEEEINIIRQHPAKGAEILSPIKQLKDIIPAIRHHHEFYNGMGYPDGLKGDDIPLMARIMGAADTFDAMGADRPYRKGRPMDAIIEELRRCSGSQFDPDVVEAFLKVTTP